MVHESDLGRPDETRPPKPPIPGTMTSHYKIVEKVGEGGMGVIYKAIDTKLGRTAALKFLPAHLICDAEAKIRFELEARAASALSHPNIATIYEIDESEGQCFISMEYVDGRSLKEILTDRTLSIEETLEIALQIGEGLSAAHETGVIHRDIKPANIMLTGKGLVKIMDFGLARPRGGTGLTRIGMTLGTLEYMSPEQTQGKDLDQRSDIFSFGVVLYEMITGRLPFKGEYEQALVYSIINEAPEPLARFKAGVPEGLQQIIGKALAKNKEERYQSAEDLLADLRREKRLLESTEPTRISRYTRVPRSSIRLLRYAVPAGIIGIIALLLLVFEPFRFEIGPRREAIARENSLAIMYFENLPDPDDEARIAQMIASLLIADLSESEYMQVVSRQRLYDILRLMGKEDLKVIDRTVASEVAKKAGVRWILTGVILQTTPHIALTSDVSDAVTGKILASQRITAEAGEDVFALVDRLSAQIRADLSLPVKAKTEVDRPVADVTTHSPEAYRYYLEGRDYELKLYDAEARKSYRKALESDSTFAMVYYRLASFSPWEDREQLVAKAVQYANKASWVEQHLIRAAAGRMAGNWQDAVKELRKIIERYPEDKEATLTLGGTYYDVGHTAEAVRYFERAVEIDSLYKLAYNSLAYAYRDLGRMDKSIWAINKYISLAPDEPNPYDSRGDLYRSEGKLREAAQSYDKAVRIKPDLWGTVVKLGHMYLFQREYARAESCYQRLASSNDELWRSLGRTHLAFVPLHQGRFEEALAVLDDGSVADRMEKAEAWQAIIKYRLRAEIYLEKRDFSRALAEYETYVERFHEFHPMNPEYGRAGYVRVLAESHELKKAQEVAAALREDLDEDVESQVAWYWLAAGCVALARGNYEDARTGFDKAAETQRSLRTHYMLGEALLKTGRLGEAVDRFEKVLSLYEDERAYDAISLVKTHYLLGLTYERSGWDTKAIEQYGTFLEIWKDADAGIPEVEHARERLARLEGEA